MLGGEASEPLLGKTKCNSTQSLETHEGFWQYTPIESDFTHRYYHATTALNSRQIIIFGGSRKTDSETAYWKDTWLFDAQALTITPTECSGSIPYQRYGHTLTKISENQMFMFGGDYNRMRQFSIPYMLEIKHNRKTCSFHWRALCASAPKGRFGHTANLIGRKIYFFGGWGDGRYRNDIITYDLDREEWCPLVLSGPVPETRYCHTATTVGKKIYVWGGNNGGSDLKPKPVMWVFDTETFRWSQIHAIGEPPSRREGHVDFLHKNKIYYFGGHTQTCRSNDLYCFDIQFNTWTRIIPKGSLPLPRTGCRIECLEDTIWLIAGSSGSQLNDIWKLDLKDYYLRDLDSLRQDTETFQVSSLAGQVTANRVLVSHRCPHLLSFRSLPYSREVVQYFIAFIERDELPYIHNIEFDDVMALLELTSLFPS